MVTCEFKNRHQEDMYLEEIEIHAQGIVRHSKATWLRGPIWSFNEKENLHFDSC